MQEATYYIPKGFHAEIDKDKVVIKKGEKPTEWSKEAENNILFLTSIIEECFKDKEEITLCSDTVCANFTKDNVIDRLKSLRPQSSKEAQEGKF